jgi:hypothetical protein
MAMILESRGHTANLVYPESSGTIDGVQINLVDGMHYPLYIVNQRLFDSFKELNQTITPSSTMCFPARLEEP